MTVVYSQYYEQIGSFSDTKYIVSMLEKVNRRYFMSVLIVNSLVYEYVVLDYVFNNFITNLYAL